MSSAVACGSVGAILWLDPEALLVSHFSGALPYSAKCETRASGGAVSCMDFDPNTYSIID